MHYFEVGTTIYPVIGLVERENGDTVPVLEITMLSDERWQQLDAAEANGWSRNPRRKRWKGKERT